MTKEEILSDDERQFFLKMLLDDEKTINAERRASATYLLFDILLATAIVVMATLWFIGE
jgi:hypothetical protein